MKRPARPATSLPPYSRAILQAAADGFTPELSAVYIGCDVELVEEVLEAAQRHLEADTLEQAVAIALGRKLIV